MTMTAAWLGRATTESSHLEHVYAVDMAHLRRDVVVGVMAAAAVGASADEWGRAAAPYLFGVVAVCAVAILADILHPLWLARRLRRQGGVVKTIGGFKSSTGRQIRYEDGTQDVDITAQAAAVSVLTGNATATVTPPSVWKRLRLLLHRP
jgi:hypothetical protein